MSLHVNSSIYSSFVSKSKRKQRVHVRRAQRIFSFHNKTPKSEFTLQIKMFIYLLMKGFSIGVVCVCYIFVTSILGNNYNKSQFQSIFLINNEITERLIEARVGCFICTFLLFNSRVCCRVGSGEQLCSSIISALTRWARCWWW